VIDELPVELIGRHKVKILLDKKMDLGGLKRIQ
jgi:hypothetical protein